MVQRRGGARGNVVEFAEFVQVFAGDFISICSCKADTSFKRAVGVDEANLGSLKWNRQSRVVILSNINASRAGRR
jgi:hypothetical protein